MKQKKWLFNGLLLLAGLLFFPIFGLGIVEAGGGSGDEEGDGEEFEAKVLGGVKKLTKDLDGFRKSQEDLTTNFDNLSKETKKAVEDLTKLKETSNSLTELTKSIERVQLQFKREQR